MTWRGVHAALALATLVLPPIAARAQVGSIHGTIAVPAARITGVVVYLLPEVAPGVPPVKAETATIDQRSLHFIPGVVTVTPGSTVVFLNSDRVMHNVFHPWRRGAGFDLGLWAPGESRQFVFRSEGAFVILCEVHPEMTGYVVVLGSPYRVVSDESGRFVLDGVAPGRYRLRTWHQRLAAHEERVMVADGGVVQVALRLKVGKATAPTALR